MNPPAQPCVATLGFVDGAGQVIPVNGGPTTAITLAPGASAFLDIAAPNTAVGAGSRMILRPVASTNSPTCMLSASSDIFDGNGNSVAALPQDPMIPAGPVGLLNRYGMKWLGPNQFAKFTVVNLSTTAAKGDNCTVKVGFVDDNGQTLVNADGMPFDSQVSLTPGASASVDAYPTMGGRLRAAIRPLIQRVNPPGATQPQCLLATGFEVVDKGTGATVLFLPQDPMLQQPQDPTVGR
jgi:hypothetical protein